jgi:hypothetical protein
MLTKQRLLVRPRSITAEPMDRVQPAGNGPARGQLCAPEERGRDGVPCMGGPITFGIHVCTLDMIYCEGNTFFDGFGFHVAKGHTCVCCPQFRILVT